MTIPATAAALVPSRRTRLTVAILVGLLSGSFTYAFQRLGPRPDFLYWWSAARMLLAGQDPYALMSSYGAGAPPFDTPFGYPLPAALAVVPLARLPLQIASSVAFALTSALLAYLVTRDGLWRLSLFAGASFVLAACCAQWSPLIMAAALAPGLAALLWCKPTLGLAALAWAWSWRGVLGAALVGAASLLVLPRWPLEWVETASRTVLHPAPITTRFGPLLLLALLRWRNREARVVLTMAFVPQLLFFYDQLPLWLVPRTERQSLWLTGVSAAGLAGWALSLGPHAQWVQAAAPWVIASVYFPALVIVLLQPHDGPVPNWLQRVAASLRTRFAPSPTPERSV